MYNEWNIPDLLKKLDELFIKENELKKQMIYLQKCYQQVQEDKEMIEYFIMHKSNKNIRFG